MYSKRTRKGRSLITTITTDIHESRFHEVDNLDKKPVSEAEDNYEKTFIIIRDFLEQQSDGQHNLASEAARLSLTQDITDLLRQARLISKDS